MRARFVSIIFCVFALAFPALAQNRRGTPSLDRVLPQIRHSVPGTFYDAEGPFLSPNGQATYRIKWMTPDGRIIWFAVDARSGQIMGGPPVTSQGRFRADEDDRGWPRSNYHDDDYGSRYGDRDGGWDRGASRGGDQGWGRDDRDPRTRSPGASNSGRYDRGPERGADRGPMRDNDRSGGRGNDRGPEHGNGRGNDRGNDRGRDKPHSNR